MEKRGKFFNSIVFTQVFLFLSISFAFSFIVSGGIVSAKGAGLYNAARSATLAPSESVGDLGSRIAELEAKLAGEEATATAEGGIGDFVGNVLSGDAFGGGIPGHLVSGLAWAGIAAGAALFIGSFFGLSGDNANSLAIAAGLGTFIGQFGYLQAAKPGFFKSIGFGYSGGAGAALWGVGIAAVVFVALYKEESKQLIQFQCLPWEAPLGGQNCEACNDGEFPCSEYRCKALGQACDLVNEGTSEEKCVWVSPDDVTSPIMTPWQDALTPGHSYTPNNAVNPPNRGVRIVNNEASNGCIAPFTPLEFGITTDEPSRCKIDYERKDSLEEMQFFFGSSNLFRLNHTERLRLPSPGALNDSSPILQNDGTFGLYVKCMDANGNENANDFVFNFCVDPSPDTTPPIIEDSSIADGSPVAFNSDEVDISVFVNEPAECKWSIDDKAYSEMENAMSCSTQIYQQNAQQLYECSGTLTGIQNNANNDFYFRCKDQPNSPDNLRNTNTQSFVLNLLGSRPLNIIDFGPNETVTGSTGSVDVELFVETSNGANNGESTCYFSPTGNEGSYIAMFNTNSFEHSQTLSLDSGNYEYFFRCIDAGGNSDTASTQFSVFVDQSAPIVTRAYKEGADALKIVTNEDAQCVYSLNSCNYEFDEGINLIYSNTDVLNQHFAEWNTGSVYYVKCRDEFGNEPGPNQCSITVTASDLV